MVPSRARPRQRPHGRTARSRNLFSFLLIQTYARKSDLSVVRALFFFVEVGT